MCRKTYLDSTTHAQTIFRRQLFAGDVISLNIQAKDHFGCRGWGKQREAGLDGKSVKSGRRTADIANVRKIWEMRSFQPYRQ